MIRNLEIEHRICRNNLGETDDQFAARYVAALTNRLQSEYPGAAIAVNIKSDFANACQTLIDGDGDEGDGDFATEIRQTVDEIANLVWDRM